MDRQTLHRTLSPHGGGHAARRFRVFYFVTVLCGLAAVVVETMSGLPPWLRALTTAVNYVVAALFCIEWALRIHVAPEEWLTDAWRARLHYLTSPAGVIDLLAAAALPLGVAIGLRQDDQPLFCVLWVLKFTRYSTGLSMVGRVIRGELAALTSVLTVFCVVLLISATLAHLLERERQAEAFGSIPAAMWWAIVTLTTTGYGDVVPQTVGGRIVGGFVMVSGIAVFAMWAGILANGFAVELRRRSFLRTWDLVSRVPLFADLGSTVIADIVRHLRVQEMRAGTIVFHRGQIGDCMYFIVSGRVRIELKPTPVELAEGAFFGEFALITGAPRSATVTVLDNAEFLVLDIADFRDLAMKRPELTAAIHAEADRRRATPVAAATAAPPTPSGGA
jgi:voltage-gated potassium channel